MSGELEPAPPRPLPPQRDWIAHAEQQFLKEVDGHVMNVLHHSGLYRHLRFQTPGTRTWSFDLITWPGYLTIVGDIGHGYTFTRNTDMFNFFHDPEREKRGINPYYWSQKLVSEGGVYRYAPESVVKRITEAYNDYDDRNDELWDKLQFEIIDTRHDGEDAVCRALNDFWYEDADGHRFLFYDTDMDLHEYDHSFLIACHAILWGIKKYRAEYKMEKNV